MSFELGTFRVKSVRNVTDYGDVSITDPRSIGSDSKIFEELLPTVCAKFNGVKPVFVKKEIIDEDAYLKFFDADTSKSKRIGKKRAKIVSSLQKTDAKGDSGGFTDFLDSRGIKDYFGEEVIIFTARYDYNDRLREILIGPSQILDDTTMSVLTLIVPLYFNLRKIIIKKISITPQTIYQVSKILKISNLTEISFNDLILREANYYILLDVTSSLKSLSLCRCSINDETCRELFSRLEYLQPAEVSLGLLNLTSNNITNKGAQYIGAALRSNRHLRHLNLSGNKINDEGATCILETLMEFPLNKKELEAKQQRSIKYLQSRTRKQFYNRGLSIRQEIIHEDKNIRSHTKKGLKPKRRTNTKNQLEEEVKTYLPEISSKGMSYCEEKSNTVIGLIRDPFYTSYTKVKDNKVYCTGNYALASINLAYNDLSYFSVKKLAEVCSYQRYNRSEDNSGLVRVIIEGNNIPAKCEELVLIEKLLKKSILFNKSNN